LYRPRKQAEIEDEGDDVVIREINSALARPNNDKQLHIGASTDK